MLLRVAQEGLANVRRHAGAASVKAELLFEGDGQGGGTVRLSLTDDGRGFVPDTVDRGFGLRGMRARAERAGGRLAVTAAPGEGTTVAVELPCSA